MIIFLIFLCAFFGVLSIWYFSKNEISEKSVISKSVKEIITTGEINIGLYSEKPIENFNPITEDNEVIREVSDLVYDKLFRINEFGKLETDIVENYAKIDEKNYVFKLKEEIFFSNGKKLTSRDVKNTIESIFDVPGSYYAKNVDNIQSVKVIDENTFRINLIDTEEDFQYNLIFPILCEIENIGSGDYAITKFNDNILTVKNDSNGQVINIYIYSKPEALYRDFKDKKLDIIKSLLGVDYKKYIGEFGYQEKSFKVNDSKITLLYTQNLLGEIVPTNSGIFHKINTWKKIIKL